MNKTLLLIICDFLLLNLLALTRWEEAEPTRPARVAAQHAATGARSAEQDLVEAMRLSLADEQATKSQIASELATREQSLAQAEAERAKLAKNLQSTEQKASELGKKLVAVTDDAAEARERIARLEKERALHEAEAARQRDMIAKLEKDQGAARERIESLSVAVKVAEQEKDLLRSTADTLKQQVEAERVERQKVQETTVQLAQGVGQLAEKSGELSREIRDNRPININTLFTEFLANRVGVALQCEREGLLGTSRRSGDTTTVLVSDGNTTWALFHADETPFSFREIASEWKRIALELKRGERSLTPAQLGFLEVDPRIVAVPLDEAQVAALGARVYPLAKDPFRFPDAMIVSRGGAGFGETPFKLEAAQPTHVRMDRNLFKRLMGNFAPSRGDLVFSRAGEFLGVMVTSEYCAVVGGFKTAATLQLPDTSSQGTERLLQRMDAQVRALPQRLQ